MTNFLDNISSLYYFQAEFVLCFGILLLIILSVYEKSPDRPFYITISALCLSLIATFLLIFDQMNLSAGFKFLFLGSIVIDFYANFFKVIFLLSVLAIILLTYHNREVAKEDWSEYYCLILISTLGMFLMSSSLNLLMIYLAIEMVSIPSYMLAGFNHNDKGSNEASMKYVLYGSFASGLMLFGMSWIYGQAGSLYLNDIGMYMMNIAQFEFTSLLSFLMLFAGFGYKISSAPFHYWVPDVYEGAPSPITAFFAVAPKLAGFALLIRFLYTTMAQLNLSTYTVETIYVDWNLILAVLSAVTMTIGNILAIRQSDVKRVLAYSSISHVGFIMMGFAVVSFSAVSHMLFYMVMYSLMTLGAFAVLILLKDKYSINSVDEWNGVGYLHPIVCSFMVLNLLSLAGLPPTSGFVAKFYIFASIIESKSFYWLAVVAILNTVVALYYYFNIARAMFLETGFKHKIKKLDLLPISVVAVTSIQGILFYFYWSGLYDVIQRLFS
tara:strand:+ start:1402 stop:2889 length:1488 start_codon:yes stop_codon:yes gene_type:complete